ncbi:MAG: hypothetical protein V1773_03950 [bacterium]
MTLLVNDFTSINQYQEFQVVYNGFGESIAANLLQDIEVKTVSTTEYYKGFPNVEYKVYWNGLSYIDLFIDKITAYDDYGKRLITTTLADTTELHQEINFTSTAPSSTNLKGDPFNRGEVVGWYPIDEPDFIDMQQPLQKLGQLINTATPEISLMPAFACSWDGRVDGPWTIEKITEYAKEVIIMVQLCTIICMIVHGLNRRILIM